MANDVLLIDAVDAGTCDVALVNHYYLARELEDRPDLNVKLYWASPGGRRHPRQPLRRRRGEDQRQQGPGPGAPRVAGHQGPGRHDRRATTSSRSTRTSSRTTIARSFGTFKPMPIDAEAYGALNAEAVDLLAEAGYK